jgi:hypothetical protein
MSCKIRNASDRIALHFDVRGHHLADEGLESAKLHDEDLVLGCGIVSMHLLEQFGRTYCSLLDFPVLRLRLFALRGPDSATKTRLVATCPSQLPVHL